VARGTERGGGGVHGAMLINDGDEGRRPDFGGGRSLVASSAFVRWRSSIERLTTRMAGGDEN
jgi:hypothetical protein